MPGGSAYLHEYERAAIQNHDPRHRRSCPCGGCDRVGAIQETCRPAGPDVRHPVRWSDAWCGRRTRLTVAGVGSPAPPARGEPQEQQEKPPTQRAERPRVPPRGSSGSYRPAPQPTPSLTLTQPSSGPYIPPPVDNPSARINELNHSFPLNRGLGNNPSDRDSYIRYNLNR